MSTVLNLAAFLALFRREDEPVSFRTFPPRGGNGPALKRTASIGELSEDSRATRWLHQHNRTSGIYFVVNVGGDEDKDITRYTAVFVENDNLSIEDQHKALAACPLPTSIRIETKKSVHAYWLLDGDCTESEWRAIQAGLIAYFDGDPKIKNPSRVMRPPGFNHVSIDESGQLQHKPVDCVQVSPERRYTPRELTAAFPQPEHQKRPVIPESNGHYETWNDLNSELLRRILNHSSTKTRGEWAHTVGVCHNGKGKTALALNLSTGAYSCQNGCTTPDILKSFGLPPRPDSKPAFNEASPKGTQTARRSLADVRETFQKWLHMPDPAGLYVTLGTVAANLMRGDPVWLMIVAPPGSGKTELLNALKRLPDIHFASTLTAAALLSGTPKRDTAKAATGGKLRDIGPFGFLVCKDFTSVLSMARDARGEVLAALREIFDGAWTRLVGTDGGRELAWKGKMALLAGCTPAIDSHHSVIGAMGERFVFVRLPVEDDAKQGMKALEHLDSEAFMRDELADAVAGLFSGLIISEQSPQLAEKDKHRLIAIASLAVRCRSAVERDGYRREIELVPAPEAPTRLGLTLARLMAGMNTIGVDTDEAWRIIERVALDSMPQLRRDVFELLRVADASLNTTKIAEGVGYPSVTVRRACEDMTAHGVVERQSGGEGKADFWNLSAWATRTLSDMSEGEYSKKKLPSNSHNTQSDISEKLPRVPLRTAANCGAILDSVLPDGLPEAFEREGDYSMDSVEERGW